MGLAKDVHVIGVPARNTPPRARSLPGLERRKPMSINSAWMRSMRRIAILCLATSMTGGIALAQTLSSAEVKKLTASANTPADHMKLAKHYESVAAKHDADAKEHEALAEEYSKNPTGHEQKHPNSAQTASHCKTYAEHCRKAAEAARQMAASHTAMAKQGTK